MAKMNIKVVNIKNGAISIGSGEFLDCKNLTEITIPDSVTNMGMYAFMYCPNLQDVYYNGSAVQWKNINIGLKNKDLTKATIHYGNIFTSLGSALCLYDSGKVTVKVRFNYHAQNGILVAAM